MDGPRVSILSILGGWRSGSPVDGTVTMFAIASTGKRTARRCSWTASALTGSGYAAHPERGSEQSRTSCCPQTCEHEHTPWLYKQAQPASCTSRISQLALEVRANISTNRGCTSRLSQLACTSRISQLALEVRGMKSSGAFVDLQTSNSAGEAAAGAAAAAAKQQQQQAVEGSNRKERCGL